MMRGGVVDDLIISNDGVKIFLVLNASRKEVDLKVPFFYSS